MKRVIIALALLLCVTLCSCVIAPRDKDAAEVYAANKKSDAAGAADDGYKPRSYYLEERKKDRENRTKAARNDGEDAVTGRAFENGIYPGTDNRYKDRYLVEKLGIEDRDGTAVCLVDLEMNTEEIFYDTGDGGLSGFIASNANEFIGAEDVTHVGVLAFSLFSVSEYDMIALENENSGFVYRVYHGDVRSLNFVLTKIFEKDDFKSTAAEQIKAMSDNENIFAVVILQLSENEIRSPYKKTNDV